MSGFVSDASRASRSSAGRRPESVNQILNHPVCTTSNSPVGQAFEPVMILDSLEKLSYKLGGSMTQARRPVAAGVGPEWAYVIAYRDKV